MPFKPMDIEEIVASFDRLSDDAVIPDSAAARILHIGTDTLKRQSRIPRRWLSERRCGRRVGDIRAVARGEVAA